MVKYICLLISALLVGIGSFAQNKISPRLESVMIENKGKVVHAVFRLSEQWNTDSA